MEKLKNRSAWAAWPLVGILVLAVALPSSFAAKTSDGGSLESGASLTGRGGNKESSELKPGVPGYEAFKVMKHLSGKIGARVAGTEQDVQAQRYIAERFAKWGLDVERQKFNYLREDGTEVLTQNIVATKKGASAQVLIVGAHYDSVDAGQGADDNASGVGVLLETAKNAAGKPTPYTIKFVAFGAEEEGTLGSGHYVSLMSEQEKKNTVAMINLDSLAAGDALYLNAGTEGQSFVRDLGLEIAESLGLELAVNPGLNPAYPAGTTGDWSDHAPFQRAGIPIGYFEATNWTIGDLDGYTQNEKDGAIWHTPKDNLTYILANYPGRVERHLNASVRILTRLALEFKTPGGG
ncbi:M28 family peptidase [Paenibacillaceae bacterium WGS1546]|uniref:M28 family peptidase n=1 Tax=Cohnella sp. WGS1546 TaxID=3366810 RepID=UPI00372D1D63